jgi:hypothetical protein
MEVVSLAFRIGGSEIAARGKLIGHHALPQTNADAARQTTSNAALWTRAVRTIACSLFRLSDCKTTRIFGNCSIPFGHHFEHMSPVLPKRP